MPVGWNTATPVPYYTDRGGLGSLSNADAVALVKTLFARWADVPTATIAFSRAGATTVDINASNFGPFLGPFGGATSRTGQNVIVFDADGAIFDTLFGVGTQVLGFADPTFFSDGASTVALGDPVPSSAKIIEGLAFVLGWPMKLSLTSLALALGVSSGVGIVFGFFPARKAAKLDPVLALGRE